MTGPGRAEVELEARLTALGLRVRMWPAYDAYDVHITFADGWVWAVDVKDWAHPAFLGRAARPVPPEPRYDEAFWVVLPGPGRRSARLCRLLRAQPPRGGQGSAAAHRHRTGRPSPGPYEADRDRPRAGGPRCVTATAGTSLSAKGSPGCGARRPPNCPG
ncbi:hypothetical protein ACRAWF_38310 [Streptomyces sp. L7]